MLFICGVGEDSWASVGLQGDPKGNQSWIYIGRTDAEAEAPILWLADAKSWLIGKDPDVGKDWKQEEKGTTEDEMVGWYHGVNGHEFEQTLGDGEGQGSLELLQSMGSQRAGHDWAIEQQIHHAAGEQEHSSKQRATAVICKWLPQTEKACASLKT